MMNGHAGGRDIRALMQQLARENGERVKMVLMRFGLSGVAFDALGGNLVKCLCDTPGCSGHAIQFEGRIHFVKDKGIMVIPRIDAAPMGGVDTAVPEQQEPVPSDPPEPVDGAPRIVLSDK
jgi:hypothetical protein